MFVHRGWKALPRGLVNDHRVLAMGPRAFALLVALILHSDDMGVVPGDRKSLQLMALDDGRLLRQELPKLVNCGLLRRFITRADAKPGTFAPQQSEIKVGETAEQSSRVVGRSPGISRDSRFRSWFWCSPVVVRSLNRQRTVDVRSPFPPRDWPREADLEQFVRTLLQHCSNQTDPDQSQDQGMPSSKNPGVSLNRMPGGHTLDGQRPSQGVGRDAATQDGTDTKVPKHTTGQALYTKIVKSLRRQRYVRRLNDYIRLFMKAGEPDPIATGRFPQRLDQPLRQILDLLNGETMQVDGEEYGLASSPLDACLYRVMGGVLKHRKGVQTSNALLGAMLKRDYLRSEENDAG